MTNEQRQELFDILMKKFTEIDADPKDAIIFLIDTLLSMFTNNDYTLGQAVEHIKQILDGTLEKWENKIEQS